MAGSHRSGRKPAPKRQLQDSGSYRPGKHNGRPDNIGGSLPVKPDDLSHEAEALWDHVIRLASPLLLELDGPALAAMCRVWALLQEALRAAEAEPLDPTARVAVSTYSQSFNRMATAFGLATPVDRLKLPDVAPKSEADLLTERFLA